MACRHETGGWPLVRRIRWLRILQYVLAGVIIAVSAYLLSLLKSKDAELGGAVTVPIIMGSLTFILTVMQQWFGTHLTGYYKRGCLILFIFFDVLCIGLQVPIVAVLGVAGLPANCNGVATGLDSSVFGVSGHGLTAKYCAAPNICFWLSIILMFLYVYTISLVIRQIVAISRDAKALRKEQKAAASNERIAAITEAHRTPPRNGNSPRPNWGHGSYAQDQNAPNVHDLERNAADSSPPASSASSEEPPPYIHDDHHDLASSLKKN